MIGNALAVITGPTEIERLRARVEELEDLLGLNEKISNSAFEGPHRTRLQIIAQLLLARQLVSKTAILLAIGGDDLQEHTAVIYVSFLRKQLARHSIVIRTEWSRGWYLDGPDKTKLRSFVAKRPEQLPTNQRAEGS